MLTVKPQPVPLRKAEDGTWRVGNTRVLFDLVVYAFNNGRTPEEIVQSYDTLQLEDVYAVIAYYLAAYAAGTLGIFAALSYLGGEGEKRATFDDFRNLADHLEGHEWSQPAQRARHENRISGHRDGMEQFPR